ncbi:MAG: Lrp/AsnC family transcriptional regulator [Methylococcaceae bacterium]|nr:Lrp/AsnC family transcriptional regulator [Methylococcaceae bacterium]MDZ4157880.1 Lrp/AsnC family transcriptional regulator [Methylococcales bacterium]MDP2392385.1 Lrp/AsnC family transcriptional regulator [Methylococcaceae bacterium]MDP3021279.1 Lrp/AsnC family transcriptional regulator [Methylococcaceae bacterium]MDP3390863.1 Lrp/AsnC family transcriptional regulator [Methylococcaceae bacterium]
MLTPLHKRLLNDYQRDFPLSPTPYQDIALELGVSEEDVIDAFVELDEQDVITRIGPVIPPNRIGVSTLAAISVPETELEAVAQIISAYPEVNHNYEREHRFNLWFVVIAADAQHLAQVLADIEQQTGYPVMSLPLMEDYFIDLSFKLDLHDD